MKILAHLSENIAGFSKPCKDAGHEWIWWEDGVAAFDAFDRHQPDVAFLDHKMINGAAMKRIAEYEGGLPMIIAQEVGLGLCFHYNNAVLSKAFTGVTVPVVVDTNAFYVDEADHDMECDIAIVCEPDEKLRPLLFPVGKHNVRIYGPRWPNTVQYVGNISVDELRRLYLSADITYVGSAKEAVRVAACGGIAVSMNKDVDAALGEAFYTESIESLLGENNAYRVGRREAQQKVAAELTCENILERLKEKGLKL
jgi:hypothetical protein